ILKEYVEQAQHTPGVQFVTAQDLLQLYRSPIPPPLPKEQAAGYLKRQITFVRSEAGDWSAADLLLALLGIPPQVVDGPTSRGATTYTSATIPEWLFERSRKDVISFINAHHRLPSQVFIGAETLSLADFAATAAAQVLSPGPVVVEHGQIGFEKYISTDPKGAFS